jgi:hypothetical protein
MTSFQYPVEIVPEVGIISSLVFWVFIAIVASKPHISRTSFQHNFTETSSLKSETGRCFRDENGFTTTREQVLREFRGGVKLSVE